MSPATEVAKASLGPMLVGTFVDNVLTGIAIMQLVIYLRKFKYDYAAVKLLVITCALINVATATLNSYSVYQYAVLGFDNVPNLLIPTRSMEASLFLMVFPSTFVQLFFAWRVARLLGRVWVLVLVCILVVAEWGFCFTATIIGVIVHNYSKGGQLKPYLLAWWGIATFVDMLITSHLVWYFQSRPTSFRDTQNLLDNLTKLTIKSGALVMIWAIAVICLMAIFPQKTTAMLFALSLAPMYSITLLASLNARYYGVDSRDLHWSEGPHISQSFPRRASMMPGSSAIHVTTTVEADSYDLVEHVSTTSGEVKHVAMADDYSLQDSDRKLDVQIRPGP